MVEMIVAGLLGVAATLAILCALYMDRRLRLYREWQGTHRAEIEQAERVRVALTQVGENALQMQVAVAALGQRSVTSLMEPFEAMRVLMCRVRDEVRQPGETELAWWHRHIAEVKDGGRGWA